jgi:hypothetical protein
VNDTTHKRRDYFNRRRKELETQAKETAALRRQDWWSLEYFNDPYLLEAPTSSLHKRYLDISGNMVILTPEGKISLLSDNNRDFWTSRLVHVQEELFARGDGPQRADDKLHIPNPTYPEIPPGLRILNGRSLPDGQHLVKVGNSVHMKNMLEKGEVKISPVASYADEMLTAAIYDNELELTARYSSFNRDRTPLSRSAAASTIERRGEIVIKRTLPNFYAYCLTYHYDHRLLDDFHADSIVLIKEPIIFIQKLVDAVKNKLPSFQPRLGAVGYYDPYGVEDWDPNSDGFLKHFRYAYQREFRVRWQSADNTTKPLESFLVYIGDMRSYAELLTL